MNVLQQKLAGNKMKIKTSILALIIAAFIFFLVFFFMIDSSRNADKSCLSTVKYKTEYEHNSLDYTIYYRILFRGNGIGYADMRGVVKDNENEYVIARNLIFNYSDQKSNTHFEAKIEGVVKTGQDNVPDSVVEKYLSYIMPDKKSYFRLDQIAQGRFLLSASQGPFLVCSGG
ncbi:MULTISPECIES: FidL-like protein [unclassified Serratia (in: enterobacteria)]|uniref:FidL-like protein n=1 Tax=unclassified Serratia (in: enterobacteria) TaxID=2647522 RepID=UPI0009DCBA40|nr:MULTISPECIES: FidL-like protein [unclassified Serratia (in: enterobacteria)]